MPRQSEPDDYDNDEGHYTTNASSSGNVTAVSFHPSDTTVEIPFPRRYVLVGQFGTSLAEEQQQQEEPCVRVLTLSHPRHRDPVKFALSYPRASSTSTPNQQKETACLLEVQERKPHFANTWFLDEKVEPESALYVLNQFDPTWLAIALSTEPMLPNTFASRMIPFVEMSKQSALTKPFAAAMMMKMGTGSGAGNHDDNDVAVRTAATLLQLLEKALATVCDVRELEDEADDVDDDGDSEANPTRAPPTVTRYYRFSEAKTMKWLQAKHEKLCACQALRSLLGITQPPTEATSPSTVGEEEVTTSTTNQASTVDPMLLVLRERAFGLLQEYLPPPLVQRAMVQCLGEAHAAQTSATPPRRTTTESLSHSGSAGAGGGGGTPSAAAVPSKPSLPQPAKAAPKSASVKRLEKAGPPKGTPTLFQMFAKKQQQQQPPPQ